jgi:hypothetical protein
LYHLVIAHHASIGPRAARLLQCIPAFSAFATSF